MKKLFSLICFCSTIFSGYDAMAQTAGVCLYEHINYGGDSICFSANQTALPSEWNDKTTSLTLAPGAQVELFADIDYGGQKLVFDRDTVNLVEHGFNDLLSSLKVIAASAQEPAAAVCFYEHSEFRGGHFCGNPGTYNIPGAWNDRTSSIRVMEGYQVEIYEHGSLQGASFLASGDVTNLVSHSFNDIMSSFRVTRISDPCIDSQNCDLIPDVTAITVTDKNGRTPEKGEDLVMRITLKNNVAQSGLVRVTPYLTSHRFSDYSDVELPSFYVDVSASEETSASIVVDPFLLDLRTQNYYAIGRGDYEINRVAVESANGNTVNDTNYQGKTFNVGASGAVLPIVVYDAGYFSGLNYQKSPETYVNEVFSRTGELYRPDSDSYEYFVRGFDQMMGVQHFSNPVPGFTASADAGGFCEQATAYVETTLGLNVPWGGGEVKTNIDHHGFDYAIALTSDLGGGVACGWINVQVSGYIGTDLDRQQIVMVHESGHLFGAPHCDPLQGYVMCAGEKHPHYQENGIFVWHQVSREQLSNRFD